jgi:hypothetical protein
MKKRCLVFGAISPWIRENVGASIGNKGDKLDYHGDQLGNIRLPNDRWRRAHDAIKNNIFIDARSLRVQIQQEVYGIFAPYMSQRGRTAFRNMETSEKRKQVMIPDLVTGNHPNDSPLACAGNQMWEIKRVHGVNSFKKDGTRTVNNYYKNLKEKGADKRQEAIPAEYEKKAKTADKEFGAQGRSDIEDALKAMPKVKGLVVGAFGELSSNFEAMIEGFAMEGALKRPEMFGTKDPLKAKGIISWYLKKRWSRVAVATAVQCRIDAMAYVGGRAQEEAANKHAYNQERGQWAYEQERLDREYQDSRHHF